MSKKDETKESIPKARPHRGDPLSNEKFRARREEINRRRDLQPVSEKVVHSRELRKKRNQEAAATRRSRRGSTSEFRYSEPLYGGEASFGQPTGTDSPTPASTNYYHVEAHEWYERPIETFLTEEARVNIYSVNVSDTDDAISKVSGAAINFNIKELEIHTLESGTTNFKLVRTENGESTPKHELYTSEDYRDAIVDYLVTLSNRLSEQDYEFNTLSEMILCSRIDSYFESMRGGDDDRPF